jgi:hypothetical protein
LDLGVKKRKEGKEKLPECIREIAIVFFVGILESSTLSRAFWGAIFGCSESGTVEPEKLFAVTRDMCRKANK